MQKILSTVMVFIFALLVVGCGEDEMYTTTTTREIFNFITDDAGRDVPLDKKPERIVVTSASFLEPLHAVGGNVVGRPDSKTQMPDWAKDIDSIGQVYNVDVEKVML